MFSFKKILIVGAGLAGSTIANFAENNHKVEIIQKESYCW